MLLHLLLAAATAAAATPAPAPAATVNTTTYTGLARNGVDVFLGIRYGQDTSGAQRFRPPRAYAPPANAAVVAATDGGPACAQADSDGAAISEDCLRLNVVRPKGSHPGSRHAVMVFIHGGGFWEGAKDEVLYEPDGAVLESVRSGQPIVHVAINYRLNVFGFAQHPDLLAEGSTNIGLRDQRLALEWVRANIAQFGGDPSRVTIYGQSSGGLSVGLHLLAHAPSSPPPFQRAIMQSTALEKGITGTYTAEAMSRVLSATNCSSTPEDHQVACLRALPMAALVAAAADTYSAAPDHNIGDIWLPQVDGDFLPDAPSALVRGGRLAGGNVSAVFGWCEDDMTVSTPDWVRTPQHTRRVVGDYLRGQAASVVDGLVALYPSGEFRGAAAAAALGSEYYRTARIIRDLLMVCPPVMYARHLAAAATHDNSVFLYNWNQTMHPESPLRITHASELAYVFGNLSHPDLGGDGTDRPSPADARLRDRATRSWSAFAAAGRPDQGRGVFDLWKPAFAAGGKDAKGGEVFIAGGPGEGMVDLAGYERLGERCAYIEKYVNID
ncbi:hypothetical protein LMH87_012135 [Akanthomyces muscarius]|uniref:Carboxylic ester hydrolase n=1 Tax=Akanthomyces muscarius TaxID=2231603 RepID=A0A9W8QBC4_AKAMU|nr:hypothetical protein LMH87_012135 [Akanthomyces muscarius]KAJ4151434.1 hypothetical protein LMH87_012135 [Akanthomyces muscarius]